MELAERTRQGWEACEERAAAAEAAAVAANRDLTASHAASDQLREDLQVLLQCAVHCTLLPLAAKQCSVCRSG